MLWTDKHLKKKDNDNMNFINWAHYMWEEVLIFEAYTLQTNNTQQVNLCRQGERDTDKQIATH